MSILMGVETAEFSFLKETLEATAGNLSVQIDKLEKAKYISVQKTFKGKRPLTTCKIELAGIAAFEKYVNHLKQYIS